MFEAIYFDMDGTIADLYGVDGWLEKLRREDETPYYEAMPMVDVMALSDLLEKFARLGVVVGVISWLAMNSTKSYDAKVRQAKKAWLDKYLPQATECHFIKYGTTKKSAAKYKNSILVDDNAKVRKGWTGYATINANEDILKELKKYLDIAERML